MTNVVFGNGRSNDNMKITYEQYIDALTIVKNYHDSILNDHNRVLANIENKKGNQLLKDFLENLIEQNQHGRGMVNSIKYMIDSSDDSKYYFSYGIEYNNCTVEYFLTQFLESIKFRNKEWNDKPS